MKKDKGPSPSDRQLSLIMALLSSSQGFTKQEILKVVPGYLSNNSGSSLASIERKFERDKEELSKLGFKLTIVENRHEDSQNVTQRYLINPEDFQIPENLSFDAEEIALLNLAAKTWQNSQLSSELEAALTKLKISAPTASNQVNLVVPKFRLYAQQLKTIQKAVADNKAIEFNYLKPSDPQLSLRRVDPLAVVQFDGHWHLFSYDHKKSDFRVFLVNRIVGDLKITRKEISYQLSNPSEKALARLKKHYESQLAKIELVPSTLAETALSKKAVSRVGNTVELNYLDLHEFATELAAFGPEVVVLEPKELVELLKSKFNNTAKLHTAKA